MKDDSARLAEEGEIDASLAAVQSAERLEREHDRLQKKYTEPDRYIMGESGVMSSGRKVMRVGWLGEGRRGRGGKD